MVDDYHNMHAKKVSTTLTTSTAVHMASCILDVHPAIPAVQHPVDVPLHRPVITRIGGKNLVCNGGIDDQVVAQKIQQGAAKMRNCFIRQLPTLMSKLDPRQLQESMRQLRQVR